MVATDLRSREKPAAATGEVPQDDRGGDEALESDALVKAGLLLDGVASRLASLFDLIGGGSAQQTSAPTAELKPTAPAALVEPSQAQAVQCAAPAPRRQVLQAASPGLYRDLSGDITAWSTNGVIASGAPCTVSLMRSSGKQGQTEFYLSSPEIPVEPDVFFELTVVGEASSTKLLAAAGFTVTWAVPVIEGLAVSVAVID